MVTQLNNVWATAEKKIPYGHAGEYMTENPEFHAGSATHMPLPERAFSGCGTGSRWSEKVKELNQLKNGVVWLVPVLVTNIDVDEHPSQPSTVGEKLTAIRDAFGLSTAALASILIASRASVYSWLENKTPNDNFVRRIDQLNTIAAKWKELNPYHFTPGRQMKQKLGEGAPMLEQLSREELDLAEIRAGMTALLALMKKYRERMDKAKRRASKVSGDMEGHREILERVTGSITADR